MKAKEAVINNRLKGDNSGAKIKLIRKHRQPSRTSMSSMLKRKHYIDIILLKRDKHPCRFEQNRSSSFKWDEICK